MDEKFLNYLKQKGKVTVAEVQKDFGIDYVSARKMFEELENSGIVEIQGPWFVYTRSGDNSGKTGEKKDKEQTAKADAPGQDSDDADEDFLKKRKSAFDDWVRIISEKEGFSFGEQTDPDDEGNEEDADDDEDEKLNKFHNIFRDGKDKPETHPFIRSEETEANTRRNSLIKELDQLCSADDSEKPDLEEKMKAVIADLNDVESFAARRGTVDEGFFTGNRGHILCQIEDISVERGAYKDDLELELSYPDGTPYEISLVFDHFLTDNGKTFAYIEDMIDLTDAKTVEGIKLIAAFYSVEIVDGVLYKFIEDSSEALIDLMRFAVAIDEISMCDY